MATDIKGKFENNRRRETSAVTAEFPLILEGEDIREGTAEVTLVDGAYTASTIPAGTIVTGLRLVVDEAFNSGTSATLSATIGGTSVLGATTVAALGLTDSTTNLPMLVTANADLEGTFTFVGTAATEGNAKIVIEYTTYNGATLSYLGED